MNGLRINLVDKRLEPVNRVNLTLWRPEDRVGGEIKGLALGGLAVVAEDRMEGMSPGLRSA